MDTDLGQITDRLRENQRQMLNKQNELLDRIENALGRLDTGEYGYCEACGSAIGIKRLEDNPAESHCGDCDSH